jgi:hypothetical protein
MQRYKNHKAPASRERGNRCFAIVNGVDKKEDGWRPLNRGTSFPFEIAQTRSANGRMLSPFYYKKREGS